MVKIGIIFFAIFIIGNFAINYFYKNKRKQLLDAIGSKDFIQIKNIKTEIYSKGILSVSWRIFISEIILFEDNLFVMLKNSNLGGIITQYQPIIQISRSENSKTYDGVLRNQVLENVEFINTKVRLYSTQQTPIKFSTEIELNFRKKNEELKIVTEFIKEKLN